MPRPRNDENKQEFINRCVPILIDEGKDKDQATATCSGLWENRDKRLISVPIRSMPMPNGTKRYRAYAVTFNGPDDKDLYDTYFDHETDYMLHLYRTRPWFYEHGSHPDVGSRDVGVWDVIGTDEHGVYVEGFMHDESAIRGTFNVDDEVERHLEYREAIDTLIEAGVLYPSSGTMQYMADIDGSGHVRTWPIVEVSSTVSPGDWRMMDQSRISPTVRSALAVLGDNGGNMDLKERLRALLDGDADTRNEAEAEADAAADANDAGEGSELDMDELTAQVASSILEQLNAEDAPIRRAIEMIDGSLDEMSRRIEAIEDVVEAMAGSEAERLQNALSGEEWVRALFVASRDAEPVDDDTAGDVRSDNLQQGSDDTGMSLWQQATRGGS